MNRKVTYRQQYTRCGKPRCLKCKEGAGHGPYWYAYWSENGRTISKYIGIHPPAEIAEKKQPVLLVRKEKDAEAKGSSVSSLKKAPVSRKSQQEAPVGEARKGQANVAPDSSASQAPLRAYLLGQFRLERREGGEWQSAVNRTWQRRRARALLGCLLSQAGRRMGREQIMEALWPDLETEVAANRLNGAVHELRQILEPGLERPAASKLLRLERDILILADVSHIWVDADAFEALLNKANATKDPAQVEQLLEEAWALYEGDYLLEELYSEWATTRRESLRRGWMGLLLRLAELRAERGALTSAIEPLDRLLTADPTHETAVRRLMVLLTQLDRRGEAIRAYQQLASILKRDYESEPLPETVELYNALRQGQIQVSRPLNDSLSPTTASLSHVQSGETLSVQDTEEPSIAWQQLPRPALPPGRQNQSPLVGREHELEAIRQILLAINTIAPQAGSDEKKKPGVPENRSRLAHFVMIMGETGIGKTRLAEELSQEAYALGWRVAWTRVYEQEGTIPYRPWRDILRALLQDIPLAYLVRILEGKTSQAGSDISKALNPAATAQAKLTRLSSLLPELAASQSFHLQQSRPPTPPAPPEQERFHLWEAMLSLLNALSQSAPLLLVLDDLHCADDSSLELLAYLARHQQNERIMLIGTCRDTELAPSANLRALLNDLRREQVLVTFALQPLTPAQIKRLLAHLPHELVQSIQSQAGGNPLFAEELARFSEVAQDAGARYGGKGHSQDRYSGRVEERAPGLSSPKRPALLPETIAAVLERRLSKLSTDCQALLSKAAVLGGSFEFGLLVSMTGDAGISEDTTLDLLEEALRSGLLTEVVNGARIVYHFWHPLIVSHLYERLSAARRAQLHRRAAQALIDLYSGNEAKGAAAIAYHLGKYGQEKAKLAYYAEMAGNQAIELSAYPEALHYYRQALEALQTLDEGAPGEEQDPMHIANLLECMAECNVMQGNSREAREQYIQVLELHARLQKDSSMFTSPEEFLAWQQEEAQVQGMIWRAIGRAWQQTSDFGQARECAERGRQVLREAGITTGAVWACLQHLTGGIYWAEGNFAEARRYMEESLEIHEEVMRAIQENATGERAYGGDVPAPLMTHSRRALLGDPLELGKAHESLGVVAASMGQYAEALQHLHTALSIMEEHDLIGVMSQVCGNIGAVHAMKAEYTIATTYFKRALELAERTGDIPSKVLVTGNLGDAAARNGDLPEAATWLVDSLTLARQISDREYTSWGLVALATVQQDLGNFREALECIRRALVSGRKMKSTVRVGFALVALADWRIANAVIRFDLNAFSVAGQSNGHAKSFDPACRCLLWSARAAAERALALGDIDAETRATGQVALANVYYLLGDLESARRHAMMALEETSQSGMMQVVGRSHCLLGRIQAASGHEQEAQDSFEQALHIFKQHGLRLDYARTLHNYGISLLRRALHVQTNGSTGASLHSTGLDYLREARDIFDACKANIDLQRAERTLSEISQRTIY
jgi:predicted ATPase/DNA-binding SARP family transcriptional activator/Tfp pilus assembly protein PilF